MAPKLANAPLTEVVFELRWDTGQLDEGPGGLSFPVDPGLAAATDALGVHAKKTGFDRTLDLRPSYMVGPQRAVNRRFFKGDSAFPILQIGTGVFASNSSADYEWD